MFWYYGMFTRAADVPTCLSFANDSFRKHNLNVFLPPGGGDFTTWITGNREFAFVAFPYAPKGLVEDTYLARVPLAMMAAREP